MSRKLLATVEKVLLWTLLPAVIIAILNAHLNIIPVYGPEEMMGAFLQIDPESGTSATIRCGTSDSDNDGYVFCTATIHRNLGDWETIAARCPITPTFALRKDQCISI